MPLAITTGIEACPRRSSLRRLGALSFFALAWSPAWAFAGIALGDPIQNAVLPGIDGGQHQLLGDAKVNVFVFCKPGQDHTEVTLRQLAHLEKELAGRSVRWVAVCSDRVPRATAETSRTASGVTMPILFDAGDVLFGSLGVTLEPSVGMADATHRLVAYQPFTKVNYVAVIRARILHLLKEIDDGELARVLHPPPTSVSGDSAAAQRRLKLAEKLFAARQTEQALANVNACLEKDPTTVAAYVLKGRILATGNQREDALRAFARALELDPTNEMAKRGHADLGRAR